MNLFCVCLLFSHPTSEFWLHRMLTCLLLVYDIEFLSCLPLQLLSGATFLGAIFCFISFCLKGLYGFIALFSVGELLVFATQVIYNLVSLVRNLVFLDCPHSFCMLTSYFIYLLNIKGSSKHDISLFSSEELHFVSLYASKCVGNCQWCLLQIIFLCPYQKRKLHF